MWPFKPNVEKLKRKKAIQGLTKAAAHTDSGVSERARRALVELLSDTDAAVRGAVAKTLGETRDPQFVDPLVRALRDTAPEVVSAATEALRTIGKPAIQGLVRDLTGSDRRAVLAAASAFTRIPAPEAVEPLIATLRDNSAFVRLCAVSALGQLGDERAMKPLKFTLKDTDSKVRSAAGLALASIRKARGITAKPATGREAADEGGADGSES